MTKRLFLCVTISLLIMIISALLPSCVSPAQEFVNKGDIAYKEQRWDDAITQYRKAIELDPGININSKLAEVYIASARSKMTYIQYASGINDYLEALKLDNSTSLSLELIQALGDAAQKSIQYSRWDEAINFYKKLKELDANFDLVDQLKSICLKAAQSYQQKKSYDEAIQYYDKYLEIDSTSAQVYYLKGYCYLKMYKFDLASQYLSKAITIDPTIDHDLYLAEMYTKQAIRYNMLDKKSESNVASNNAIAYCLQALRNNIADTIAYQRLAAAYLSQFDYSKAMANANKCLQSAPNNSESLAILGAIYLNMGRSAKQSGNITEAMDYVRKAGDNASAAHKIDSLNSGALSLMAESLIELANIQVGEFQPNERFKLDLDPTLVGLVDAFFSDAMSLDSYNPTYYYQRARWYAIKALKYDYTKRDNLNAAISDYNSAIALEPAWYLPYIHKCMIYCILGQYNEAISDGTNAIKIKPDESDAYYWRGTAYFLNKSYDLANDDAQKAMSLATDSKQISDIKILIDNIRQINNK